MATGAGWQQQQHQQQQQQHPPPPPPPPPGNPAAPAPCASGTSPSSTSCKLLYESELVMEYTHELHLKMSKKIAQLTKVIYALNTKNDEHEEAIRSLKDTHDDELEHVLSETREKILQYRNRVGAEAELKRRLHALEESLELHEQLKHEALTEFELYRRHVEEMRLSSEEQHSQHVTSMQHEAEELRCDFEEKLRSFSQLEARIEQEKQRAMDELKSIHHHELQELMENHQKSQSTSTCVDQEELIELEELIEELKQEKENLEEEYEAKLDDLRAFYEREFDAMRRTQQLTTEKLLAWKRSEVELRKEFQLQEAALQRTLCKLRSDLHRAQEEARESRDKTNRLQASLNNAEVTIKELHKQLEEAIQDGEIWVMQLKDTEYELEGSRDRVQQQATEILHKASQIGTLQATQMSHEATIKDLQQEQSRLREKIVQLEEEKDRLQSQSQALDEQQRMQILNLEKALFEQKQAYELDLAQARSKYEEEAIHIKENEAEALNEVMEKHRAQLERAHSAAEREKDQLVNEMKQQYEIQRLSLEEQRSRMQQQLDTFREELTAKLNIANQEVSHLKELVKEGETNLDSAENHISRLKENQEKLLIELDATRARVRETSHVLTDLQEEIESQKQQHEVRIIAIKAEEKQKMDKITKELDNKWTDALRAELKTLREELTDEYEADKQAALSQLSQQKDVEIMTARESWHRRVEDLLEQISLLKQSLELQLSQSNGALQQLQSQFTQERQHLAHELHEVALEHQQRERHLQDAHCCTMQELEEARQLELREQDLLVRLTDLQQEANCRKKRVTDLDHEIHTLNETISTLTKELELKGKEVLRVRGEANLQIRGHEQDLSKRHEREISELNATHNREMQIMLSDFNKAQELLKDKISALQILLDGTEDKFRNRESRQEDLQRIADLREMVAERESLVKKLVDDKKFYQLELVNRDTSFNKVFNTSPNVGVINPLIKHKSRKAAIRFVSSPNLSVVETEGPTSLESVPSSPNQHAEHKAPSLTLPTQSPRESDDQTAAPEEPQELSSQYFSF
ncbi:protein FAM184A isoform X2 [Tachysurus ichikawai]